MGVPLTGVLAACYGRARANKPTVFLVSAVGGMRLRHLVALVIAILVVRAAGACAPPRGARDPGAALFEEAVSAARAGDFRLAFDGSKAAIQRAPELAAAYRALADAAFMMGRPQAAIDQFSSLIQHDAANVHAQWGLGLSHRRLGRYQDARAVLEEALDLAPGDLRVLHELLVVARAQRDLDAVYAALDERRRRPGVPRVALTYAMAEAREMAYRLGEAEALARESLALQPLPETYALLARVRHEQSRYEECIQFASEGIALAARVGSVEAEAAMRLSRADSLAGVDRRPAAETERRQALEMFQRIGDASSAADARRMLAISSLDARRNHESLELIRQAIAIHGALGEKHSLARDLQLQVYPAAQLLPGVELLGGLRRALALVREVGDERAGTRIVGSLGASLLTQGNYGEALPFLLQALDAARRLGARRAEAVNAGNLAELFEAIGDWPRAIEYNARALRIYQEAGSRGDVALTLGNMGRACFEQRDLPCAESHHRRVVELSRPLQDAHYLDGLVNLARDVQAGGRFDEARRLLVEASRVNVTRADPRHSPLALAWGDLELAVGRHEQAREHFERVLRSAFAEDNEPAIAVRAHRGLAASAARRGDLAGALAHYRRALQWLEDLRRNVTLRSLRLAYLGHQRDVYVEAVGVLFDLNRTRPAHGYAREAFEIAEKARARALLDSLGPRDSANDILRDERKRSQERISRIQGRLFHDALAEEERSRLQNALSEEEARLADLDLEAAKATPSSAPVREPGLAPLDALRAVVGPDDVLVEFLLGDARSFAFVAVKHADPAIYQLPPRAAIEDKVRQFRQGLTTRPAPGETSVAALDKRGVDLFDTLLAPAVRHLSAARRVIIVPDGMLFYLPFEALAESVPGPYLAERFEIGYAASATVLSTLERRAASRAARALVAFGDPTLSGSTDSERPAQDAIVRALELGGFRFPALPNARREVESIAGLFARGRTSIHVGDRFREDRVRQELARPARFVHFATHAAIDEDVPARSGIIVARGRSETEDGILQAREIADLRIEADLVTLSACQTGLGAVVGGEGVLGLARAFQEAGARSLVVSLWNVSDYSTATFMTALYQALAAGGSKTAALKAARLELLRSSNPALRHPYYWAAFVLLGAP
jgi:CHAT domain-containing protein/Tfp pilus assembly protein PilF